MNLPSTFARGIRRRGGCFDRMGTLAGWLLLAAAPDPAFSASPGFSSITPAGAQRGSSLEVRFSGARLEDAQEVIFHEPGIEVVRFNSVTGARVKALVKIDAGCRLGEHHVRLRTASGISELRTFYVGPFPAVKEKEPNDTPLQAQEIALNSTIEGVVTSEDLDCFLVTGRKGQRLSAEIEAMRLGRGAFDPHLVIEDAQGKVLGVSDDTALLKQDALVSVVLPADGKYIIKTRETSYGGSSGSLYRLHVGDFPRPVAVYPPGGQAGREVQLRFIGDPAGDLIETVMLPRGPRELFGILPKTGGGVAPPSMNWLRVSSFPNVLEVEPNDRREQSTINFDTLPLAFNGIISRKGDVDWFRFSAMKDQRLDLDVYARRLRSPLDVVLSVHDAQGKSLSSNDDGAGVDAALKFRVPESGEYLLQVRDHLGDGGEDYTYRVEVTPTVPGLSLGIPEVANNDTQTRQYIPVGQGNLFATLISARRSDFTGDLEFLAQGLPDGVKLHAMTMPGSVDAMPLVFEASAQAALRGRLTDLTARGEGVEGHFRQRVELVRGPNNTTYYTTEVDRLYVAVTEPVPFKLRIIEPKVPLVQSGNMELRIEAQRYGTFDGAIRVKMVWNPPGIGSQPDITIPKGESRAFYPVNAQGDAATGRWPIAVLGSGSVGGGTVWASSQLAGLEVAAPFLTGKITTASAEPGGSARIVCMLEQRIPFAGKAAVKLVGLSDDIKVSSRQITSQSSEVVFDVTVGSECRIGSQRGLFCSVEIDLKDGKVLQSIATGGKFRVVPPSKKGTKVAAQ